MLRLGIPLLWLSLAWPLAAAQREVNPPPAPASTTTLALTRIRLIDGRGGPPLENATVVIRGDRIVAAGRSEEIAVPPDAERIEAPGLSVVPGLVDAHLHTTNPATTARAFLANGVTAFRDPGHPFRFYAGLPEIAAPLPRIFLTGSHLDVAPPAWPEQARLVANADDARRAVDENVAGGASAIKLYFRMPVPYIAAACEAARARGVLVTAHLELVDPVDAIRAGVRGIEHLTSFGLTLATPAEAARFRAAVDASNQARTAERFNLWASLDLDDKSRVDPLLATLVRERVYVCPTLGIFEVRAGDKTATETRLRAFQNLLRFTGLCHRAGVMLVVGSHTSVPHAKAGWAYQHELELFVEAGLTPMEALQAATRLTARYLDAEDRLGTIEPGKAADLMLVEGNPAQNIRAMSQIRGVLLNGSWVKKP